MRRLAWALPILLTAGCSMSSSSGAGVPPDTTGGGASHGTGSGGSIGSGTGGAVGGCNTDACPLATPAVWDVEIDPPSSSSYALKQVLARDVSVDAGFRVAPPSSLSVAFAAAPHGGTLPTKANVALTVPPLIPGRPDLSYQVPAAIDSTSATATLALTSDALGTAGTISLVPLPTADQQMPPYSFATTLAATNALTLPEGDVLVSGQVTSAVQGTPNAQFVARAFQNGVLVSNAPLTQAKGTATDGSFQLQIPAAAAANPVTLEFTPTTTVPWVVSMPFSITAGKNLGTVSLPAYPPSNAFNIAVMAGNSGPGVAGVTVRAQTTIGPTAGTSGISATAQYTASGSTDAKGNVVLQLLPGSANAPLKYLLSAIPPPGSPYAPSCHSVEVLPSGSTSAPPLLDTFTISNRPVLIGVIHTATRVPVPNVTVTATGTPDQQAGCPAPDPLTATTVADANGTFQLPLDPGTYQLDYDPPGGANAPRMTQTGVTVDGDPPAQDVMLPPGALVKGSVIGPDGAGVPSATVRFFERRCDGQAPDCFGPNRTPPWLRGKALTDATGQFRMIVPIPNTP